jgi:hypothetical protein
MISGPSTGAIASYERTLNLHCPRPHRPVVSQHQVDVGSPASLTTTCRGSPMTSVVIVTSTWVPIGHMPSVAEIADGRVVTADASSHEGS